MTRYYVMSDLHGFYDEMQKALTDAGYYTYEGEKKIIICGDVMDRGKQAKQMQQFVLEHMQIGDIILVKGNHESLMQDMIEKYWEIELDLLSGYSHHIHNDTFDTALQLTNHKSKYEVIADNGHFINKLQHTPFVKKIIPAMSYYYETKNYIFVHSYIPIKKFTKLDEPAISYNPHWRTASTEEWEKALWGNGMNLSCVLNINEPNKKIVFGHWHCSDGWHTYSPKHTPEFGEGAIWEPFETSQIMAIDRCTAYTHEVNCVMIDDEDL